MNNIICSNLKCKKKFSVNLHKVRTKEGYIEIYFTCPHCNERYHCYFETDYTLALQDRIDQVTHQLNNFTFSKGIHRDKEVKARNKLLEELKKLKSNKKKTLLKINK